MSEEEHYFQEHEAQLNRRYAGKVVVIRGRKVVAVYETEVAARRESARQFGEQGYWLTLIAPRRPSRGPFSSAKQT